jgi:hypothetical protein
MCDYSKMQELSQNSSRAEVKVDSSGRGSSGSMPKKYFGSWDLGLGRIVWSILGAQEIHTPIFHVWSLELWIDSASRTFSTPYCMRNARASSCVILKWYKCNFFN